MKAFTKLLIISMISLTSLSLYGVAGIGEHYDQFGDKVHCRQIANDIYGKEKKKNKNEQDIKNLEKLRFNYSKANCAEKLKPKNGKKK